MDFGSNNTYIFSPFSLFVSVYVYASVCDFHCIALLLPFVLGFCLPIFACLFVCFYYLKIIFYFNKFILYYFIFFFLSFFLFSVLF